MSGVATGAGADGFAGTGWKFPIQVNARGGIGWSSGAERIADAIWIILATSPGERVMRPGFGAGVQDAVFDSNSSVARTRLAAAISAALTGWEPRISLVRVDVTAGDAPSQVNVAIDYTVRSTNELFNLVFPFYVQEGVG